MQEEVDDEEEPMSEEDAVPLNQRSVGVEDSGVQVKRRAENSLTVRKPALGESEQTRQIWVKNDEKRLKQERQSHGKRLSELTDALYPTMMYMFVARQRSETRFCTTIQIIYYSN